MSSLHIPTILLAIPRSSVYAAVGLPLTLGLLSGSTTAKVVRSEWYQNLYTPPGRPPRQVFPVVWPILYLSMGYASRLAVKALDASVTSSTQSDVSLAIALYWGQLGLNLLWSPLFFNAKWLGTATIDSAVMTASTYYMTYLLHGHTDGQSTYFLAPYCAWLTFATYLSGGIWYLNRGRPTPKKDL